MQAPTTTTLQDRLEPTEHIVSRKIPNGLALLNLESGEYFELNAIGAALWNVIAAGGQLLDVLVELANTFDVSTEVLERDIVQCANELVASGVARPNAVRERNG